ncbi:MAG TPA: Hsp20/alpha crystallin family protein [Solirubrobacteraceae bacterium]|jgi:HSP20 family protein|nr:Hsp20/alpha crystallin family protein [Solirubrobacteraceae bacterium]
MPDRDLFANFERMRREMDELFGDVFERTRLGRKRAGFSPAVDVIYASAPPRAIITAELAGIDIDDLDLELEGSQLILSGNRRPLTADGEVYQQVEIEHGPFRRVVELAGEAFAAGAKAQYQDGILRVELPLAESESRSRTVPIEISPNREEPR